MLTPSSLRATRTVACQRLQPWHFHRVRHSSGAAKPGWQSPRGTHRWGPEVLDQHYFWDHPTYTGFVLWLRGTRPYFEKLFGDTWRTARYLVYDCSIHPVRSFCRAHNPTLGLQVVAFGTFYFTVQSINMALNRAYQLTMDLKHLNSLEAAQDLQHEGFWSSESEDLDQRVQNYSQDHQRLNTLWQTALADASNPDLSAEESFTQLCSHLKIPETDPTPLPSPITWRFNMIPYGAAEPATQTFPVPPHEEPHRAFALNFTYNNLSYDWGDYINRRDNKTALLRPSRMMFTDVYLPPTK